MSLSTSSVSFAYRGRTGGDATFALRDVSVSIARGSLTALLGPNGCGKTTLLKLLSGVLSPHEGEVLLDGRPLAGMARREVARHLAVVPQETHPAFDYTADTVRLRLNHRFLLAAREARLQVGYRWQDRDYSGITPVINVPRDDSQRVAEARLEVDVVEGIAVIGGWEHADYDSRLPTADFTNNRVSLAVEASF